MKRIVYIFLGLGLFLLFGCETDNNQTTKSSVAKLSAFSFAKNDSFPGLQEAVFTIEERLDTGLVWNKDSIRYGTPLDSVVPRFTFAATPGAAYLTFPDTQVVLTGYDTLNFNNLPVYLTVRSGDGTNTKVYEICPTVHQVDPDLFVWVKLTEQIDDYPQDDSEQRVVELGDEFVMIKSNGFEIETFRSADGASWTALGEQIGLPAGTRVRQIISDGDLLFYAQEDAVYTSEDAKNWTAHAANYPVVTMLLYWNSEVWVLVDNDGYELATWQDDELALSGLRPGDRFPISDFASVVFQSASERQRALIIGGFAEDGESLNTRWNLEYSPHTPENNGYRIQEFSIGRPAFTTLTGVSVIAYNDQLLLFGGVDKDQNYFGRDILISEDEGLNWTAADTTKNQLPEVYQARQKQTAIVRDNNIYLFGGQDKTTTYSDVYRGRLNSIDW